MIAFDEQALICDLAETYRIYDWRSLPIRTVATLSAGLGNNSRIKRKLRGVTCSEEALLLGEVADRLGALIYMLGGRKGDMPARIVDNLLVKEETHAKDVMRFNSGKEFDAMREELLRRHNNG